MDDETLLREFEACTLPQEQWTHRAHLRVAYLYLVAGGLEAALERMRAGIQRFNAAGAVPEALDRGYHETVTGAWLRLLDAELEAGDPPSSEPFLDAHPELIDKRLLRRYYSRERIMSWEAKRQFVEPDLAPLHARSTRQAAREGEVS